MADPQEFGLSTADADQAAIALYGGLTTYPGGKPITWRSLPDDEKRSAASSWRKQRSTTTTKFATKAEVKVLIAAAREDPKEFLDAIEDYFARGMLPVAKRVLELEQRIVERESQLGELRFSRNLDVGVFKEFSSRLLALEKNGANAVDPAAVADMNSKLDKMRTDLLDAEEKMLNVYQGVWQSGKTYERSQLVTHDGSLWACLRRTGDSPPGNNWQLCCKKGRDGRDGR